MLSGHEVYEDGTSNKVSEYDTAYNNTRQLDYYANLEVTTNNYSGAIKQYNSSNNWWWLRTTFTFIDDSFLVVAKEGSYSVTNYPKMTFDLASAFRIK